MLLPLIEDVQDQIEAVRLGKSFRHTCEYCDKITPSYEAHTCTGTTTRAINREIAFRQTLRS